MLVIFVLQHKGLHKLQDLFLDGPHASNEWRFRGNGTLGDHSGGDHLADNLVEVQHVKIVPSKLDNERVSNGGASRDVSFEDVGQVLDFVEVSQGSYILTSLANDGVPLSWLELCLSYRF